MGDTTLLDRLLEGGKKVFSARFEGEVTAVADLLGESGGKSAVLLSGAAAAPVGLTGAAAASPPDGAGRER
jgi:hypothetical protein